MGGGGGGEGRVIQNWLPLRTSLVLREQTN